MKLLVTPRFLASIPAHRREEVLAAMRAADAAYGHPTCTPGWGSDASNRSWNVVAGWIYGWFLSGRDKLSYSTSAERMMRSNPFSRTDGKPHHPTFSRVGKKSRPRRFETPKGP